jgi:hypothetical protein
VGAVQLLVNGLLFNGARSPSGKAKVCKTFIGGSIPPRASNFFTVTPETKPRFEIPPTIPLF